MIFILKTIDRYWCRDFKVGLKRKKNLFYRHCFGECLALMKMCHKCFNQEPELNHMHHLFELILNTSSDMTCKKEKAASNH